MRRQLLKSVLLVLALSLGLLACGSNEGDEATTTTTSAETTTTTAPGDTATGTGNRDLDTYCQSVAELDAEFTATGTVDPEAYDGLLVASTESAADGTWIISGLNPDLKFDIIGRLDGQNDVIAANVQPMTLGG